MLCHGNAHLILSIHCLAESEKCLKCRFQHAELCLLFDSDWYDPTEVFFLHIKPDFQHGRPNFTEPNTTHISGLQHILHTWWMCWFCFVGFFFPAGNLKAFWKCRDKKWSNKPSHQGAGSPRDPSSLHQHPKGWSPPGGWLKPGQAGKVSGQQPFWNWLSAS